MVAGTNPAEHQTKPQGKRGSSGPPRRFSRRLGALCAPVYSPVQGRVPEAEYLRSISCSRRPGGLAPGTPCVHPPAPLPRPHCPTSPPQRPTSSRSCSGLSRGWPPGAAEQPGPVGTAFGPRTAPLVDGLAATCMREIRARECSPVSNRARPTSGGHGVLRERIHAHTPEGSVAHRFVYIGFIESDTQRASTFLNGEFNDYDGQAHRRCSERKTIEKESLPPEQQARF